MEKNQRLTIGELKLDKLVNKSEVEKLLGGVAAGCHIYLTSHPEFPAANLKSTDDDCYNPVE